MQKLLLFIALVLSLSLVLAACGGRNRAETAGNAVSAAEEAGEAAEEAVAGDPEAGEEVYIGTCVACHGPDAKGVEGLGKSLHPSDSEFIREQTDAELVEFIKVGRQPDHPLNTTGVAMLPKGGNPAITDEQLYDIVAWIRTLE